MTRGVLIAVALATAVLVSPAFAQDRSAVDVKTALSNLRASLSLVPQDIGPVRQRLAAAIQWLTNNADKADPASVSSEYARAIQTAADLLKGKPAAELIEDIATELEAKVQHCRATGLTMGGSVLLKVDTRKGAAPAGNWQVMYLLKIYERVSGASPGSFPRLSTPTERPIEPGRYWIWARNPATGQMSDRTLVTVAGQKEIVVDLLVP